MKILILSALLLMTALGGTALVAQEGKNTPRTIEGMVYFTNDSPKDNAFMVELFSRGGARTRRVAVMWTEGQSGHFEFKGLKAGIYYLQVSGSPRICLLQYKVDARKKQPERLRVFGDADCGRSKVAGLPKPRAIPRDENR
jgi:hypothetical protein